MTFSNCQRLICMRLPFIMSQPASLFSSAKRLNLFSPIRKYLDASSMVRVYFSHTGISVLFIRYPLSHVSYHYWIYGIRSVRFILCKWAVSLLEREVLYLALPSIVPTFSSPPNASCSSKK